jgi:hypothetical protein
MLIYLTGPFVGAALAAGMFALTSMEVREKDTRLLVFEPH